MKHIAPTGLRIVAGLIDLSIRIVINLYFFLLVTTVTSVVAILDYTLTIIIISIYFEIFYQIATLLLISKIGGSPGKLLTGLTIVDSKGKSVSFSTAFFRELVGKFVSSVFLSLGFLWILKDKEKQGWHDMIADTFVVKKTESGIVSGLAILLILLGVNGYLGFRSVQNIKNNIPIYKGIIKDITNNIYSPSRNSPNRSMLEKNRNRELLYPSPIPDSTRYY